MSSTARWVHLCGSCGWSRAAEARAMLDPRCPGCGSVLLPLAADDEAAIAAERPEPAPAPTLGRDVGGLLALLVGLPWLLPLVGVTLADLTFLPAAGLLGFCAVRSRERAARTGSAGWRALALCGALTCAACLVGVAQAVSGAGDGSVALQLGTAGSLALLAGLVALARDGRRHLDPDRLAGALLVVLVGVSVVGWACVRPAIQDSAWGLLGAVVLDLLAWSAAVVVRATGREPGRRWLVAVASTALAGDVAAALGAPLWVAALGWSVAALCLARAAAGDERPEGARVRHWVLVRLVGPLALVAASPLAAVVLLAAGRLGPGSALWFGGFTVAALAIAFTRQAWLLGEREQAVLRERSLRDDAERRSQELEALTGLATTMTQTLEEDPIVEQALEALHLAGEATSTALHVRDETGAWRLRAATGRWRDDVVWAGAPQDEDVAHLGRGGRSVLRLPLRARGDVLGVVTFVRPSGRAWDAGDVELLFLLVDQMGVAVQNARDYREKLEQAVRDPLTGTYNRRYFWEALQKEVERVARYGGEAALVIFDVDDFKSVNDTYGHAKGDDVLRHVARTALDVVRPSDTFARIGGEEFAVLLPESGQLEALLVAERIRTAVGRHSPLADRKVTMSGGIASLPGDAGDLEELQRRADAALYFAKRQGKDRCAVASEVADSEEVLAVQDAVLAPLYAVVAMIDAQHLMTRDHSENVAAYAVAIGQALGLAPERTVRLRRAAMLHDVGKVAVPSELLDKPGRLTDEEFDLMRRHAEVGGLMLAHAGLHDEASWVRHHHERWDGAGYPARLSAQDIPLESRICFVADSFEAMTSDRPYRRGMPVEDAVAELERCSGTQFDPEVVEAFVRALAAGRVPVLALRD